MATEAVVAVTEAVAPVAASLLQTTIQDVIISTAQHLWNLMHKHLPATSNTSAALSILESAIKTASQSFGDIGVIPAAQPQTSSTPVA